MSFQAAWYAFEERGPKSGGLVVRDDSDVETLVGMLADPAADTATIYLSDSGVFATPPSCDHTVHAAVSGGYGYLSHWDMHNDLAYSSGDPESPGHESENEDFPAGSGLPLVRFADALKELLATGQRPRRIRWATAEAGGMTLRASVRISSNGADQWVDMAAPADVAPFLTVLGRADADDAYLEHQGRPREIDPDDGDDSDDSDDHVMYVAVRDRWAYLRYLGPVTGVAEPRDAVVPLGDPTSPATHGTNNVDYLSGTGLPVETVAAALTEFLSTAELPTSIQWITENDLAAGRTRVLQRST
jgi:hypothetical protein